MKHIPLTTLCVAISAVLLTACGGSGGSNPPAPTPIPNASGSGNTGNTGNAGGTDNTANAGNTGGTSSGTGSANTPEPKYQDVPTTPNNKEQVSPIQEPAMGYGMELKLRNWIPGEQQEEHAKISTNDVVKLEGDLKHKPFDNSIWQNIKNSKEVQNAYNQEKQNIKDQIIKENKQRPENERLNEAALKAYIEKALDDYLTKLATPIYEKNINDSHDGQNKARTRNLTYVRSGYIYRSGYSNIDFQKKIAKTGFDGALFYKGEQTAKQLPVSEVKYKGTWDFMTDAKNKQSFSSFEARAGNRYSAMSSHEYPSLLTDEKNKPDGYNGEYGHSSEFTVNFKDKKLTGELFSNLQDSHKKTVTKTKRYDIDASIHGNRFRGSATAHDKKAESKTQHPFTSDAKDKLEGGFYGPKGEELAGKFLTDDNKLFGVFGAKQDSKVEKTEAILDAYALGTFNKSGTTNPAFNANSKKQLDNFGNINKLVLGSTVIDLTQGNDFVKTIDKEKPAITSNQAGEPLTVNDKVQVQFCCSNLEHLKFGSLSIGDSNSVFLQGNRTATTGDKAIPVAGNAKYRGTWAGYVTGSGNTSKGYEAQKFADNANRAEFDVDFAKKSLTGKLIPNTSSDGKSAFDITATIDGNGFSGKANTPDIKTGGLKIDSKNTESGRVIVKDAVVTGGFYGPQANELGGSFTYKSNDAENKDSSASVVFGARKQQEVK